MSDLFKFDLDISSMFAGSDLYGWSLLLLIGFPVALIVLGEIANRMRLAGRSDLTKPVYFLRNVTLPLLFIVILLRKVAGYDGSYLVTKLADTAFGVAGINTLVALFNIAVFGSGEGGAEHKRVPKLFLDLLRLFLVLFGASFVISTVWNINLGSMLTALGVGSIVLGLALQDTLGGLFTGLAILSARNINVGDWIKVGQQEGVVKSMSWRSIVIRTRSGDDVVLPNLVAAKELVTNFIAEGKWHIESIEFELSFDHPPEFIKKLLIEAALATPKVLHDPLPEARLLKYDDHAIVYQVRLFIPEYGPVPKVRSDFQSVFWYVSKRHKLIFPGRYHRFYRAPTELVPVSYNSPRELAQLLVDMRALPRDVEQLEPLLTSARHVSFRDNEMILARGEVAKDFMIIIDGHARAFYKPASSNGAAVPDAKRVEVLEIAPSQFIVFRTLFNGSPTPYTVRAHGDVTAVAIPVAQLEAYLAKEHELAHEIQQIIGANEDTADRVLAEAIPGYQAGQKTSDRSQLMKDLFNE